MAVSSKKDKLIEEAQKLILRGQLDKAIKVYEQIVAFEPSAINQRQKMAELLIKAGRNEEACSELVTIGNHYSKNGFLLKAIAVYKQVQKLSPADISISLILAELNEKHGLTANALSEYKQVYDYHEKHGNIPESLRILDKMQHVDPNNVSIKLKLAEALVQNGKSDDAYLLFTSIAALMQERGDNAAVAKLAARIKVLFPEKTDFVLETLSGQVASGNAAAAVAKLQDLLRSDPKNKRVWDLVIQAYRRLEQHQRVRIAFQHYLRYFPGDPVPILGLITCALEAHEPAPALELLNQHEEALVCSGMLTELESVYCALEKLDPVNVLVLEGQLRLARLNGKEQDVQTLSSRLTSLQSAGVEERTVELPPAADQQFETTFETGATLAAEAQQNRTPLSDESTLSENNTSSIMPSSEIPVFDAINPDCAEITSMNDQTSALSGDEEIEIDIDIDGDPDFGQPEEDTGVETTGDEWLDSVGDMFNTISDSPRGVKFGNEMDASDAQSHFDLGLAFKEMGLFNEAINEFRQAAHDAPRRLECLIMQGACLRERGDFDTALSMLQTLVKPGMSVESTCAVKYELMVTYQAAGLAEPATVLLNEIYTENPSFRDVSSRLNAANLGESLEFTDDDLKDFDLN